MLRISEYLFPPRCFVCRQEGEVVCHTCLRTLSRAVDAPHAYTSSMFDFRDPNVRKIIHSMKYYGRRDLIPPLARYAAARMEHEGSWVLCPIPMPRWRKYMRGYNQAEAIAEELSIATRVPVTRYLARSKSTVRQASTRRRSDRLRAQKGSFTVRQDPQGACIILVDDVSTTGATLDEARRVLLAHGAAEVRAITLAH